MDDLGSRPPGRHNIWQDVFPRTLSMSFRYSAAKFKIAKKVAAPQQAYECDAFNYRQLAHISATQHTQRLVSAIAGRNCSQMIKGGHRLANCDLLPFVSGHSSNIMETYEPS